MFSHTQKAFIKGKSHHEKVCLWRKVEMMTIRFALKLLFAITLLLFSFIVTTAQARTRFTFNHAWSIAKRYSPLLKTANAAIHSAKGQLLQSHTYPNPSINVSAENIAGSGQYKRFESAETTVSLAQPIPLGGKRIADQNVQQGLINLSQSELITTQSKLYILLGERYVNVLYAQNWLHSTDKLVRIDGSIIVTLKRKLHAGSGSPLDLLTAQIQLSQAKIARAIANHKLHAAWKRLTLLMGQSHLKYRGVMDKGLPHQLSNYNKLYLALINSPTWKTQVVKTNIAYKRIILAKKRIWPDLTVAIGARHFADTHDNSVVADFSLPLPVYDQNQGNIASRLADYNAALFKQQQILIELKSQLVTLYQIAQSTQLQANMISHQILPKAQQAVNLAKNGYFQGRYPYVTLANAQATLLTADKEYWQAHANFDKALVEINGLLGKGIH